MYKVLNVLYEGMKFILLLALSFIAVAIFIIICDKGAKEIDKRNCYEVYATDGVILKKCEKFFEVENGNKD